MSLLSLSLSLSHTHTHTHIHARRYVRTHCSSDFKRYEKVKKSPTDTGFRLSSSTTFLKLAFHKQVV